MGSSASKAARTASAAARKYPSRVSNPTNTPPSVPTLGHAARLGPTVHPKPQASETRNKAINLDAADPTFAAQLRSLGAVQPNPHFSPTSTSPLDPQRNTSSIGSSHLTSAFPAAFPDPRTNPALMVLAARQRFQEEADTELENLGRKGFPGRKFLDVSAIRQALLLLQEGESEGVVEKRLGLRKGRLGVLGKRVVEGV